MILSQLQRIWRYWLGVSTLRFVRVMICKCCIFFIGINKLQKLSFLIRITQHHNRKYIHGALIMNLMKKQVGPKFSTYFQLHFFSNFRTVNDPVGRGGIFHPNLSPRKSARAANNTPYEGWHKRKGSVWSQLTIATFSPILVLILRG